MNDPASKAGVAACMGDSLVSVVIASYNYASFLPFALESALGQSYGNIEVIVVDDGSTDDTPQVVERYLSDPRLRYVRQENAGQPKTKNRGIAESRGEFIAFLDADDIWMPDKLDRQMPLFADAQVGVVYCRRTWMDEQGGALPGNERTLRRGFVLDYIFIDNFICFSSSVVRRNLLTEYGAFDENLPMGIDYDLWVRLAAHCQFDFADVALVRYRTGHANLSRNVWKRFECARLIMTRALADPLISARISAWVPAAAWADTWSNMGECARLQGERLKSVRYLMQALKYRPAHMPAWKGLVKALLLPGYPH